VERKCQTASGPALTQVKENKKTSRSSFCQNLDLGQCGLPPRRLVCEQMSEKPVIDSVAAKVVSLTDETQFAPSGIVSRTLLRNLALIN
jgi:hypothetical protein